MRATLDGAGAVSTRDIEGCASRRIATSPRGSVGPDLVLSVGDYPAKHSTLRERQREPKEYWNNVD